MSIQWGKLFEQGRCKAIGISWDEIELKAIYELKIPVKYVRQGILTVEDYEKVKGKIVPEKSKKELMEEAKKEGIAVTPEATVESLEEVIKKKKVVKKLRKK